jgi:hypothetical protein
MTTYVQQHKYNRNDMSNIIDDLLIPIEYEIGSEEVEITCICFYAMKHINNGIYIMHVLCMYILLKY